MQNSEFEQVLREIPMTTPFRRKSYIAMLLGFSPYYYTKDYEDDSIMYGNKQFDKLAKDITYLQIKNLLLKNGFKDIHLLQQYFNNSNWKSINNLLKAYNANTSIIDEGLWRYFKSYSLEEDNDSFHHNDIKHRLYLDIRPGQRAKFADLYINECKKAKIPYYFKVFAHKGQTDTIVIYIDSVENLKSSINIINKIYHNIANNDIKNSTKNTPPHLFKINDYIGYGFEPRHDDRIISYKMFIEDCAFFVNDKRNKLRKKILNDFSNGIIHKTNCMKVPTADEIKNFCGISRKEQSLFFSKYFSYIIIVYGTEIREILNEIEQNMNVNISSKGKTSHR